MSGHEDRLRIRRQRFIPRAVLPRQSLDIETVATLILYRDVVLDRPCCEDCGRRCQVVSRNFSIVGPISRETRTYECTACGHTQAAPYTPNSNDKRTN